jgi:outer membrane protein
MSHTLRVGVLAAAVLTAAPVAHAFEAGDVIVRTGLIQVAPDDSSDAITVGNNPLLPGVNSRVTVDSDTQLGLRGTYMLTSNLGLGLLAATPFKHDINGGGDISGDVKLGETKHLPPTLTLQYYPMEDTSAFQPYLGAGVNYTTFFEEKTDDNLNQTLGVASSELELDDSVGLALELGFDYMLDEHFGLSAALWWADINTDAQIEVFDGNGNSVAKTDTFEVEIDPMVYMVGFTYRF